MEEKVLEMLKGKTKYLPLSKMDACTQLGINEREFRVCIHNLRMKGYPIVSHSAHYGYWLADIDSDDFNVFRMETRARVSKLCKMLGAMEGGVQLEI